MNQQKKYLFFMLCALFLFSNPIFASVAGYTDDHGTLTAYTPPSPIDGTGKKLLVIYMVGSDLESGGYAGTNDFNELIEGYNALTNNNVDVIVAFGGADKNGWKGMKFATMAQIIADASDGQYGNGTSYQYAAEGAHMGDETSLTLFLEYVNEGYVNYETRFIAFWDHGGAYSGFGNDENFNSDALSLTEISNSLTNSSIGKVDLIAFDACLMGNIEVAKFMKSHADYLMGSEELEPGHGWLWSTVINELSNESTIVDTAKGIIDNFVQNVHEYESDGKTLALLDLSQFDTLAAKIDVFTTAFTSNMDDDDYKDALIYGATNARDFGKQSKEDQRVSIDLKHFAQVIKEKITDETAQTILSDLITATESFVVHSKEDGTRPNSYGVSIAPPEETSSEYDDFKLNANWLSFQNAYASLSASDTTAPEADDIDTDADWDDYEYYYDWEDLFDYIDFFSVKAENAPFLSGERSGLVYREKSSSLKTANASSTAVKGVSASFTDDNLTKVTTIYGFELAPYEDEPDDTFFMSVAEVEAYETTTPGTYFTPQWNKKWYCVEYDPDKMTEWMPMVFLGRYTIDDEIYTEYGAEIDYYQSGKDYSDYDFPADYATLKIIVDSNNTVVNHYVQTYKILYSSDEDTEGTVLIDKKTQKLSAGDKIQFWTYGFNIKDSEADDWFETSDIITFTQTPEFTLEVLEFEDENGDLLEYKYAMWAEDIAKNGTLTDLASAATSDSSSDDGTSDNDGQTEDDDDDDDDSSCFISSADRSTGKISAGVLFGMLLLFSTCIGQVPANRKK